MPGTLKVAAGSGLVAIAVTIWLWYSPGSDRGTEPMVAQTDKRAVDTASTVLSESQASPFSLGADTTRQGAGNEASSQVSITKQVAQVMLPPLDVSRLARTAMSDADFEALVARLKTDPVLHAQLIDEFRQELDAGRRAELARLLGEVGGAEATQLASELIFSGDDQSRKLGLQMLRQVQPDSVEARNIASGLLANEVEPKVLMSTLTVLANPGTVDKDSRALLSDQVALLATHQSAGVRGISLDILSRWSTDGRDTPVLLNGLQDPEPRVRESAAYALVGHEDASVTVTQSLLLVVRNTDEQSATRRAALLALRSFSLDEAQLGELRIIERELDTVNR